MLHKVCLSELFFGEQQIVFWDNKESDEQGIWVDDKTNLGYFGFTEFKIKNGEVFLPSDENYVYSLLEITPAE